MKLCSLLILVLATLAVSFAVSEIDPVSENLPLQAVQPTQNIRPKRFLLGAHALGAGALGAGVLGLGALGLGAGLIGAKAGLIGGAIAGSALSGRSFGGGWGYGGGYHGGYHGGYYGGHGGYGHGGYAHAYPYVYRSYYPTTSYIVSDSWC